MTQELSYKIPLWEHQEVILNRSKDAASYAFFMDMGTGKTALTVHALRYIYKKHKRILRTLVVCPIGVCSGWEKEFNLHASKHVSSKVKVLVGPGKKREDFLREIKDDRTNGHIVVTNFEAFNRMPKVVAFMEAWQPEFIIVDESQNIKNGQTLQAKNIIKLGERAPYKRVLSGTPLVNGGLDIFGQFRFLDRGKAFGRKFTKFRSKYFFDENHGMPSDKHFPKFVPYDWTHRAINKEIYKIGSRVLKESCMDLPPFIRQTIDCEMGREQEKAYKDMLKHFIAYIEDEACVAELALTKSLRLQQILSGYAPLDGCDELHKFSQNPRLKALEDVCFGIPIESKFVVWAAFKENYKDIETTLKKLGIKCVKYVGGMTKNQRDRSLQTFINCPQTRCMIASPASAGVGVDGMQVANYAVYYNRTYNLEHDLQSNDRIYRGGSDVHEKVTRIDIRTPGTIDDEILRALQNKLSAADAILQWRETFC